MIVIEFVKKIAIWLQHKLYNSKNLLKILDKESRVFRFETKILTTKGKSQDMPLPFCREAMVVGPAKEGIQKKPSVRSPFNIRNRHSIRCGRKAKATTGLPMINQMTEHVTSSATFERAL